MEDCDVILVGGGPVGLFPAAELGQRARRVADTIGHLQIPNETHQSGPAGDAARTSVGNYLAFHATYEFVIPGVHFGTRYVSSPLVEAETGPASPDTASLHAPCARPGHRAPHAWLAAGRSLYDRFGSGFTLLRNATAELSAECDRVLQRAVAASTQLAICILTKWPSQSCIKPGSC